MSNAELADYRAKRDTISIKRIELLKPYKVGTYREWEGNGYFISPLYKYNDEYYG